MPGLRSRLAVAAAVAAIGGTAGAADPEAIRSALQQHMDPANRITGVAATPYPGIYEVVINNAQIGYTDGLGSIFIGGPLLDMRTRVNVTRNRLLELRKVDFASLPLDKAIVKVKGSGERRIALYSDPDCPYCRQLEPELDKLTDVTIYTFLYPLTQIHPDAMRKATIVWCAPDRVRAWDDLMLRDILRAMLDRGADPDALDRAGKPALFWAAYYQRRDTAKVLVERGAAVGAMSLGHLIGE